MILVSWMLSFKPAFSLSSFTFIKRIFSSCFLPLEWYHLHIWGCWYFSWQSWFQFVFPPVQHFSWCTLHISYISMVTIYSLYSLLSQFGTSLFVVPWPVLTVASWPACRFLRRQVCWSGIPISLIIFQSLLWSTQSKTLVQSVKEMYMFFWNSSFFYDPTDIGNLISGFSSF